MARTNLVVPTGGGCGETVEEGGGGGGGTEPEIPIRRFTLCASDADCAGATSCCPITNHCFPNADPDQCRPAPEGTRSPCTSDEQCHSYEYCSGEGCDGPGGCVSFGSSEECGITFEPVCGCDGTTYTSAACAESRGVRVEGSGECE